MDADLNRNMIELYKELVGFNRDLSVQLGAQTHIIFALLSVIPKNESQQIQDILQAQAAESEPHGLIGESCRLAAELVALANNNGKPLNPKSLLLKLIPGGKKD